MEAQEAIDELEQYHGHQFSPQQLTDYLWFFDRQRYPKKIIDEWKYLNAPTTKFPSVAQLAQIAETISIREWQTRKKQEPEVKDLVINSKTNHAKEATAGIIDFLAGNKTKDQYVSWMLDMDKRYPDWGWKEEGDKLAKWYASKKERFTKSYQVRKRMATEGANPRPWMLYDWEQ